MWRINIVKMPLSSGGLTLRQIRRLSLGHQRIQATKYLITLFGGARLHKWLGQPHVLIQTCFRTSFKIFLTNRVTKALNLVYH